MVKSKFVIRVDYSETVHGYEDFIVEAYTPEEAMEIFHDDEDGAAKYFSYSEVVDSEHYQTYPEEAEIVWSQPLANEDNDYGQGQL